MNYDSSPANRVAAAALKFSSSAIDPSLRVFSERKRDVMHSVTELSVWKHYEDMHLGEDAQ